jgi:hypothetical protein
MSDGMDRTVQGLCFDMDGRIMYYLCRMLRL